MRILNRIGFLLLLAFTPDPSGQLTQVAEAVTQVAEAVTLPFTEDFEVATITDLYSKAWNINNSNAHLKNDLNGTKVMSISTTHAHSGTRSLRMQYQGIHSVPVGDGTYVHNDCCNAVLTSNFTGVPEYWERYYVYYEAIDPGQPSGWSAVTGKQHIWNVGTQPAFVTGFSSNNPHLHIGNTSNVTHICPPGATGFPGGDVTCNLMQNVGNVSVVYNRWTCIETHTGQSAVEMWIDGVKIVSYTTGVIYPPNYNSIQIYRQGADNQYRYLDDLVVSTTRVGCSGGDTQPPIAPVGLAIQ